MHAAWLLELNYQLYVVSYIDHISALKVYRIERREATKVITYVTLRNLQFPMVQLP